MTGVNARVLPVPFYQFYQSRALHFLSHVLTIHNIPTRENSLTDTVVALTTPNEKKTARTAWREVSHNCARASRRATRAP